MEESRRRNLRVAAIQTATNWSNKEWTLAKIPAFVALAASQGAELVVLPEMVGSYSYSVVCWRHAEPKGGKTTQLICQLAAQHKVHIGFGFMEAKGEHFFNKFVLCGPQGEIMGEVCKRYPCAFETMYFRGEDGPHVIECPSLGLRIGIGICYENQLSFLPCEIALGAADILLMPHCAPFVEGVPRSLAEKWVTKFRMLPKLAAEMLGIPVVLANHAGKWGSPLFDIPFLHLQADFMGLSQVVDKEGKVLCQGEGMPDTVYVAEVNIPPPGTVSKTWQNYAKLQEGSRYSAFTSLESPIKRIFEVDEFIFPIFYHLSWRRRNMALSISGGEPTMQLHALWAGMALTAAAVFYSGKLLFKRGT